MATDAANPISRPKRRVLMDDVVDADPRGHPLRPLHRRRAADRGRPRPPAQRQPRPDPPGALPAAAGRPRRPPDPPRRHRRDHLARGHRRDLQPAHRPRAPRRRARLRPRHPRGSRPARSDSPLFQSTPRENITRRQVAGYDIDFHDALFRAAHHRRLYRAWEGLRSQVMVFLLLRDALPDDYLDSWHRDHVTSSTWSAAATPRPRRPRSRRISAGPTGGCWRCLGDDDGGSCEYLDRSSALTTCRSRLLARRL